MAKNNADSTLEKLIAELSNYGTASKTEAEKRSLAEKRYASEYDAKRLAAQQSYDTQDAAYQRQLTALQGSYDTQRASSAANYSDAYSQQDRNALSKGMQRSSYNEASLSGIARAGAAAQQELNTAQAREEQGIQSQRTAAAKQLSQTLQGYEKNRQSDILSYMDELTEKEQQQASEAKSSYTKLLGQIYEYQRALAKEAQEQENWLAEFRAKYGVK